MDYTIVPTHPTSDKQRLIAFCANYFIIQALAESDERGISLLQSCNNAQLHGLVKLTIEEDDYAISNFIKKSLKLSYGGTRFFGVSSLEMNTFLTDLRNAISENH